MNGIEILAIVLGSCLIAWLINIYVSNPVFSGVSIRPSNNSLPNNDLTGKSTFKFPLAQIWLFWKHPITKLFPVRGAWIMGAVMTTVCLLSITSHGWAVKSICLIVALAILVVIGSLDVKHNLIPNRLIILSMVIMVVLFPYTPLGQELPMSIAFVKSGLGVITGVGLLLPVYILVKGRIGAGDVKLCGVLGGAMGVDNILIGLCLGITFGGVVAILLLALRKKGIKDVMPYGPSLISGSVIVMLGYTEYVFEFLTALA